VWLPKDWTDASAAYAMQALRSKSAEKVPKSKRMRASIEAVYESTLDREDLDDGDVPSPHSRTLLKGMVLHEMAVMNAHVQLVSRLLQRADKLRFSIDQESGLRAAIMSAVPERVLNRTADDFYVKVMKDFTIDEKRAKVALANRRVKDTAAMNGCGPDRAKLLMAR
jgi:hypothetical protein